MVALSILLIAASGLIASTISSMHLARVTEERAVAVKAAQNMAAQLQTVPFQEIFTSYNLDPGDDPLGANTALGADFNIVGLTAQPDDADGSVGQIQFPTTGDLVVGLVLREDLVAPQFGLPRDLNGDGVIDALNHADDYLILPVRINVAWQGRGGVQTIRFDALLVE